MQTAAATALREALEAWIFRHHDMVDRCTNQLPEGGIPHLRP
jgi:hypothetical protein